MRRILVVRGEGAKVRAEQDEDLALIVPARVLVHKLLRVAVQRNSGTCQWQPRLRPLTTQCDFPSTVG